MEHGLLHAAHSSCSCCCCCCCCCTSTFLLVEAEVLLRLQLLLCPSKAQELSEIKQGFELGGGETGPVQLFYSSRRNKGQKGGK